MESAFRQLTRGVRFDRSKFGREAHRLQGHAMVKREVKVKQEVEDGETKASTDFPSDSAALKLSPPSSDDGQEEDSPEHSDQDGDFESESHGVTLLGDIRAPPEGSRKKAKRAPLSDSDRRAQARREAVNRFRNLHRIHVWGTDVPDPLDGWRRLRDSYGFSPSLCEAVEARYPGGPTPVQMQAVPAMLERREVLACAPTGSGKTAAYLLPLVHLLGRRRKDRGVRAVVVAPTRELALQIFREAEALSASTDLRLLVLDGKKKKFSAEKAARYDVLISTPNRLIYLIKGEGEEEDSDLLKNVEWLVVDESDKLFEAGPKGFRDQLAAIYRACDRASVCRGMFSATLAVEVEEWCKLNLDNVLTVTIGARNTAIRAVEQSLAYVGSEKGKLLAFKQLVSQGIKPPVLVFVQTKDRARDLLKEAEKLDLRADVIHSDRSQLQRDSSIRSFRAGRVWVLICTELLGRGIDFKGVNLVVNYDFPPSTVSYIHRIGRTGRAGRSGRAVTFFTDQDKTLLRSIATVVRDSGGDVPDYMFKLKKASRQEKRKLAKRAVEREAIIQESKYDRAKRIKKEDMIAGSKRRKRKAEEKAAAEAASAEGGESACKKRRTAKKDPEEREKKKRKKPQQSDN